MIRLNVLICLTVLQFTVPFFFKDPFSFQIIPFQCICNEANFILKCLTTLRGEGFFCSEATL